MERVLLDQVIETDYGQFDLIWGGPDYLGFSGDFDLHFDNQVNGLVGASHSDGIYLVLGRRFGGSPMRICLVDEAPDVGEEWEDIVEVPFTLPVGHQLGWTSWAGESGNSLPDVPPGTYRMRVSARGRDRGRMDQFEEQEALGFSAGQVPFVDVYLLQLWQTPWEPDAIVRVGSEDARYWHRELGSRR